MNRLFERIADIEEHSGIILFDIDNTLLVPDPTVIGVWKIKDGKREWLNAYEYDHDPDLEDDNPDVEWDFVDFRNPEKIRKSIIQGTPLLKNLKMLDAYLKAGYSMGYLTARGCEETVDEALDDFLKVKADNGELVELYNKFHRGLSAAVNDEKYMKIFGDLNGADRKAEVLKYMCKLYKQVVFVDDSKKNVEAARALHLPNLKVIVAQS
jgi:FMN phosphatase YigB (HAD superfamily)